MSANGGDIVAAKTKNIDMVNGPLFKSIIRFSIPLVLSNLLQILYHAADVIVAGRFAGREALAGVGSTGAICSLLSALFLGISVGVQIVASQALGSGDKKRIENIVHTSVVASVICGGIISVIGIVFSDLILAGVSVPENVIPQAKIYMQITFIGRLPSMIYNFMSGILHAKGDSKTPMYISLVSGAINVILNLFFVIVFGMGAGGVALATLIAQLITAVWILIVLFKDNGPTRLYFKKLKIHKDSLLEITRIGVPSGLQSIIFQFSNVIVQRSINSFGDAAIAGNSAASSVGDLFYALIAMFLTSCAVFVSQNYGAKNYKRINKTILYCLAGTAVLWAIEVVAIFTVGRPLLDIYAPGDTQAINMGYVRLLWVVGFYGLNMASDIMAASLRSIGYPIRSLISSFIGVCGVRIMWVYTVFSAVGTFESLLLCFPLSWICTLIINTVMFMFAKRSLK